MLPIQLVLGKTGVGKSTLINKVFGIDMVGFALSWNASFIIDVGRPTSP